MMLDGMEIADRTHVVALGISTEGVKIPLGLWEGTTENATLVAMLLADLVDRGLDPEQAILFVIDGGKALRRRSRTCSASTRSCTAVTGTRSATSPTCCPSATARRSLPKLRGAWALKRPPASPSSGSSCSPPSSSAPGPTPPRSLREGLEDTLTLMRLGIGGQLAKTLCSTNPCESMIEIVRHTQRNVKRWQRRRHAQALDCRRDARRRAAVPADHRLPRPRQARDRDRAARHPSSSSTQRTASLTPTLVEPVTV